MALFRWLIGMPMAALVTAALFFLMAELIRNKGVDLAPPRQNPDLNILAEPPPETRYDNKPPRPVPLKPPPETQMEFPKSGRPTDGVPVGPGTVPAPGKPTGPTGQFSGAVIKVTPPYPEGCRSKGAEGVVVVQFDVTPEGNVTNARVIESPNACFVRPILKAVSGWKYPPSASGSQMRYGLVETFNFQLVD